MKSIWMISCQLIYRFSEKYVFFIAIDTQQLDAFKKNNDQDWFIEYLRYNFQVRSFT